MRPNKTPDLERWELLIAWIYAQRYGVLVTHGPNDVWTGSSVTLATTDSLDTLVFRLAAATAVVTVDNGIGHIASALGCRTLILWPPISSVPFIAPTWSKTTTLLYMQPARVRADQLRDLVMKELQR
jgi:ADP-heptose:LPS heptosyltransferase